MSGKFKNFGTEPQGLMILKNLDIIKETKTALHLFWNSMYNQKLNLEMS